MFWKINGKIDIVVLESTNNRPQRSFLSLVARKKQKNFSHTNKKYMLGMTALEYYIITFIFFCVCDSDSDSIHPQIYRYKSQILLSLAAMFKRIGISKQDIFYHWLNILVYFIPKFQCKCVLFSWNFQKYKILCIIQCCCACSISCMTLICYLTYFHILFLVGIVSRIRMSILNYISLIYFKYWF